MNSIISHPPFCVQHVLFSHATTFCRAPKRTNLPPQHQFHGFRRCYPQPGLSAIQFHRTSHQTNGPGRPFHGQVVVITISRIPEIEIEELDRLLLGNPNDETLDYDYDTEDQLEEWVMGVARF